MPHRKKNNIQKLEEKLLAGISSPEKERERLGTQVYPHYRRLLLKYNQAESYVVFFAFHGYCQNSEEAMKIASPHFVNTSYKVKLFPIVPRAIKDSPHTVKPIRNVHRHSVYSQN